MSTIKSVHDGFEPWEVLYDVVLNFPERLYFHIGEVISIRTGLSARIRELIKYFTLEKPGMIIKHHGGELLTRCDPAILPQPCIGSAFNQMPVTKMKKIFPRLLEQQLQFISTLSPEKEVVYSVNLEGLEHDLGSWQQVCELLLRYGNFPVNVELKENALLSPQVMGMLAKVCAQTKIRIYIDDLCSCCHKLPENEDYLIMMISELHPFIKAVKVDYLVMQDILYLENFHQVKRNLYDFRWLWESWCNNPLPSVIFESMPRDVPRWTNRLEELAAGYYGCCYQRG